MFADKIKITIASFIAMLVVASCTEVDFCSADEHPHFAEVQVNFDWQDNAPAADTDMYVVAYRIVKGWNSGYMYSGDTGRYIYNAYVPGSTEEETPSDDETADEGATDDADNATGDTDASSAPAKADESADESTETSPFYTRTGDIRFLAVSYTPDNNTFSYGKAFLSADAVKTGGMAVFYKTYSLSNPLIKYGDEWNELNPYAEYIIGPEDADKVYACFTEPTGISVDGVNTIDITPADVCQNIEFRFDIAAEGVTIDKVVAEVSGVAPGWNFSHSKPMSGNSHKVLFPVEKNTAGYSGNISVFGLSRGKSWGHDGAGVLQIAIHTAKADGTPIVYNLWMNLYKTISAIGSPIYGSQEPVVLDIDAPVIVTPDGVTLGAATTEGDRWTLVK